MACRLDGAKPLPEPMLEYCYVGLLENISVKFQSEFKLYHWRRCPWKCRLRNDAQIVSASTCYGHKGINGPYTSSLIQSILFTTLFSMWEYYIGYHRDKRMAWQLTHSKWHHGINCFPRYMPFVTGEFTDGLHSQSYHDVLSFSFFLLAWSSCWTNKQAFDIFETS